MTTQLTQMPVAVLSLHTETTCSISIEHTTRIHLLDVYRVTVTLSGQQTRYEWRNDVVLLVMHNRISGKVEQMLCEKFTEQGLSGGSKPKMVSVSAGDIIEWHHRRQRFTRRQKNYLVFDLRSAIGGEIGKLSAASAC